MARSRVFLYIGYMAEIDLFPLHLLARSVDPIMEVTTEYERNGFFKDVIFTNGHVVRGDALTIYYGAADKIICGATFSIGRLLDLFGGDA